jgi:hypothetical protein
MNIVAKEKETYLSPPTLLKHICKNMMKIREWVNSEDTSSSSSDESNRNFTTKGLQAKPLLYDIMHCVIWTKVIKGI